MEIKKPRFREADLTIRVLVEVSADFDYKNLESICSQNSHGQWISNHLVNFRVHFYFHKTHSKFLSEYLSPF